MIASMLAPAPLLPENIFPYSEATAVDALCNTLHHLGGCPQPLQQGLATGTVSMLGKCAIKLKGTLNKTNLVQHKNQSAMSLYT